MDVRPTQVAVPGGFERGGAWQRVLWLRPWSGRDELLLCEELHAAAPAVWATALLSRCVSLAGGAEPATPDFIRSLTVGDREALLLQLRRVTLGDVASCVLTCPECGEKLDLDLRITELLLPAYSHEGTVHETVVARDTGPVRVRFRLPTGADQEAAADLALRSPGDAAALVLRRCVLEATDAAGTPLDELPPAAARELAAAMSGLDPQAELRLRAQCPACEAAFETLFDTAQFLRQEMTRASEQLYREIHLLAFHYHWGEGEILSMTGRRRHRYLALLGDALGAGRTA